MVRARACCYGAQLYQTAHCLSYAATARAVPSAHAATEPSVPDTVLRRRKVLGPATERLRPAYLGAGDEDRQLQQRLPPLLLSPPPPLPVCH
eukprot:904894-Rhodomonas_salina.1